VLISLALGLALEMSNYECNDDYRLGLEVTENSHAYDCFFTKKEMTSKFRLENPNFDGHHDPRVFSDG